MTPTHPTPNPNLTLTLALALTLTLTLPLPLPLLLLLPLTLTRRHEAMRNLGWRRLRPTGARLAPGGPFHAESRPGLAPAAPTLRPASAHQALGPRLGRAWAALGPRWHPQHQALPGVLFLSAQAAQARVSSRGQSASLMILSGACAFSCSWASLAVPPARSGAPARYR